MRNFVRGSDNLNPNDVSAIVFCFASSKILLLMCLQSLSKLSHKSLGGYAFTMTRALYVPLKVCARQCLT